MFRTYPVTVVRIAAVALVLYFLLNLSSETIKVSAAFQQRQFLLRDLVRYFLLLVASVGFFQLYRPMLGRVGKWTIGIAIFTSVFGIAAYLCLSLNLLLVPETSWQTSLLAFFEFLKSEFTNQFQAFIRGKQSLAAWITSWKTQLQFQFLPQAGDFPIGRGWIKLYLLFKLLASVLLKVMIILACGMFLFPRPLSKQNLFIALLIMLWILSPIFGSVLSILGAWIINVKAINGEAVRNVVALTIVSLIAIRMWLDAPEVLANVRKVSKKKTARKTTKSSAKKSTKKPTRRTTKSKTKK